MRPRTQWLRDAARSRPLVNVLLLLLSALAVLAAVLGPLLVRSVAQSGLADAVAAAGADGTSVTVGLDLVDEGVTPSTAILQQVLAPAQQGAAAGLWAAPQTWAESSENLGWTPAGGADVPEAVSRVQVPADGCADLTLVTGRCPTALGEVLVSTGDLAPGAIGTGSTLVLRPPRTVIDAQGAASVQVEVTGTYDAERNAAPIARPGTAAGTDAGVSAAPLVMTAAQATALQLPIRVLGRLELADGLDLAQEPVARAAVAATADAQLQQQRTITLDSGLPALLDRVDAQRRSATVLVLVTEVQALGLAVFALAVVLQRVARARTAEWGIGRLRGVPRRRWFASIYVEPAVALVLGWPVGVAAGLLVARLTVAGTLRPGTPVELWRGPVLLAAGAVGVAFLLALLAVSAPSLRRPLVELIQQRSEGRRTTVLGAVAQAAVVLLAAATLYELVRGGVLSTGGSQLGLLAPGLFALALAVVAVRVAVLLVPRVTARPPRSLVALVVGRQAARTPSSLNPAVVIAVGVALSVFATQVLLVSERNQDLRARAATGAATVLQVDVPNGVDLRAAVRAADPGGQAAMAVRERAAATDTGVGRLLAVDSSRLPAVSAWSPTWSPVADLGAALDPPTVPPVTLTGRTVQVDVADVRLTPGPVSIAGTAAADPELTLTVAAGPTWTTVRLGPLGAGGTLTGRLPCADGCRLVSLGLTSAAGAPWDAAFTVTAVRTDVQPAADAEGWLRGADRWQPKIGDLVSAEARALAVPSGGATGLQVTAFDRDGGNPAVLLPADALDPLPALVAPATGALPFAGRPDTVFGTGLDGQPQLLRVVGTAAVLPRLLDDGVLVDLGAAAELSDPAASRVSDQVWLAPGAPAAVEEALTAAGLRVTGRDELAGVAEQLQQQPSTRAAAAAGDLGQVALLLTLVALVAARVADVSRRRPDWRSLRDAGLSARAVRGLAFVEIAVPAWLGALLGLAGGVVASALATPRLPLVDLAVPGPPLELGVAWSAVAVLAAVVTGAVLVVALVLSRLETRFRTGASR